MKTHRRPAVAGTFYPGEAKRLENEVSNMVRDSHKKSEEPVKFLIVPHAGYIYSGLTAAAAYVEVLSRPYDKIVLLGPSHRYRFDGIAESGAGFWDSPLGASEVMSLNIPKIIKNPEYHRGEHSLEVQIPFLQMVQPETRLVPLLLSGPKKMAASMAETLIDLDDSKTLWVVSSDFNHTGPDFGHMPEMFGYQNGEEMDLKAIDHIQSGRPEVFERFLSETGSTICGALPILVAMLLIQKLKNRPFHFKKYDCSSRITRDENSVGYGALYA